MVLERDPVDGGLDGGVQQLHDQHQDQAADEQRAFHAGIAQPERERRKEHHQDELLAERVFVLRCGGEPRQRVMRGVEDPAQPGLPLVGALWLPVFLLYVGIPSVNSSSSCAERRRPRRGFTRS